MNKKNYARQLLIVLSFFLTANLSWANSHITNKSTQLEWKNIDVDGQRAAVFCIYSDSRGIMWLGTSKGLFLFDGANTHSIHQQQLSDFQVYTIVEHANSLILGTNRGLIICHTNDFKIEAIPSRLCGEIRCMLNNGNELFLGSLNGLYAYNYKSKKIKNIGVGLPHHSVYSLFRDSRGNLYVGTYNGLAIYNKLSKRFSAINSPVCFHDSQRSFINCMLESQDHHTLFIGTGKGLLKYNPLIGEWTIQKNIEKNVIKSLSYDKKGNLLIGTNMGLYYKKNGHILSYKRNTYKPTSLAGNQIWTIMTDAANNIFVGHGQGLSIAANSSTSHNIKINTLISSEESNEILTIHRDRKGGLWFGGTNGVIIQKTDGHSTYFRLASSITTEGNCVRSITEDTNGIIWLSTDGGIYRYNSDKNNFDVFFLEDTKHRHISNWIYSTCQVGSNLWIGSYLGGVNCVNLSKFNTNKKNIFPNISLTNKELGNDKISNIVSDRKGNLWILAFGDRHLYQYHIATGKIKSIDIRKRTGADPTHICIDDHLRLWCAYKGGVLVFKDAKEIKNIRLSPIGSEESILAMAPVGSGIWLSGKNNLWDIDGKKLSASVIPIQQKGFKAIWDDKKYNKVILGGLDEITEIDKKALSKAQSIGKIRMILNYSDGEINNLKNLITQPTGLSVPYNSTVTLLVSTLDYAPDIVQHIEYKLRKNSSDNGRWVLLPEQSSTITLAGIGSGDYELLVKTVGSPFPPVSIPLSVGMPVWLSWYAILFYVLIIVFTTTSIIWLMHRRSARLAQEKEREETLANVETKLAFLSNANSDMKERIEQLLKSREELTSQLRLHTLTNTLPPEEESKVEKTLYKIVQIVEKNISNSELKSAFVSEQCGISEKQLYRIFKKEFGITLSEYIRKIRIEKAATLLRQNYFTISEVAYMVGFSSPSYFSKCFQEHFNMSPSTYQSNNTANLT